MRDFRTLTAWRVAHALALRVHRCTESFPASERFELAAQLRTAASSVAANIAEGCGRNSQRDFKRFLGMALGSASELEYHLLLAYDLRMLSPAVYAELSGDVVSCKRMLAALIAKIATDCRAAE